jgi:hypothetical protein
MQYHYLLTLQYQAEAGKMTLNYKSGTTEVQPWETRSEVFLRLFSKVADLRLGTSPVPLMFSLEPEEL